MSLPPTNQEKYWPSIAEKIDADQEQINQQFDLDPADIAIHAPSLRGRKLTAAVAFVAGTGFTLLGYDQGVMSSLITGNQFEATFPEVVVEASHPNHATLQSFTIAIYEVGCLFGALSNLWVGDKLGRRRTIALGGSIMMIGAILQTTAFSFAHLIFARIFTGCGTGLITSTVPTYHAELSPSAKRGRMIMMEGTLIVAGVAIAYVREPLFPFWIDLALFFVNWSSAQWRVPISLQLVFEIIVVACIGFLPESPRWLVKHGRNAEAMAVISAMEDKPPSDPEVQRTYYGIREAVAVETSTTGQGSLRELITGGRSQNFRRTVIAVVCQMMQQLTGINLVTYYATILFQRLGLSDVNARITAAANGTEYFLASFIAYYAIDYVGRRQLMLIGAIGQSIVMLLLAILGYINNGPAQIMSVVLLFGFNTFFAIGWLGMAWLYCAELAGLRTRAQANALSTASNWTFNFVVVMVVGPSFNNISWRTYIVFAALNAAIVPVVYFFFPETGGRSLEDLDVVFALAHTTGEDPVKVSLRKDIPLAGSREADEILGVSTGVQYYQATKPSASFSLSSETRTPV
ncbi:general substrate transporter [Suillus discolor]|uniref:General substrate transporter n=1 Tax=Suillus discolor TaxID=1912936 RepID=A0A9P7ER92_9AGAM|nr:general substrate transporter [Suillus discolor]XP_041286137.1 general substrate transporter [Suillus discolor]KAG2081113.1 general substrate transporter [Suillus discolor]KAG2090190.1 general substrate transporter [Suillus discolor]